ncbi:glycoside hydrolase family 20 zincin-like fold domain-containing protein [Paenibacillus sp. HJGM_3]|uniref:glycoside hydrolase family 20 zincin-like fold domain-containing protein n=1 Tax=Paenibacillus sp. HJGM_3 TaxID=3379816 RepID=UPI00385CE479
MSEYRLIPEPKRIVYGAGSLQGGPGTELAVGGAANILERVHASVSELMRIWQQGTLEGEQDEQDEKAERPLNKGTVVLRLELVPAVDSESLWLRPEGYELDISAEGIQIRAVEAAGVFYGLQTLIQIVKQARGGVLAFVHIEDAPDLLQRGVLVDLRFQSYRMNYLIDFVKRIAQYKINVLSIEYSNKFPYRDRFAVIRDVNAFTTEEVDRFVACCRDHFIELIPMVQSFGHMEYVLHHDHFRYLREDPNYASQCCPLHEDSIEMTRELLGQIQETHKHSTKLFIGGDETFHLGKCPKCSAFVDQQGKGGLYVHYVNQLADVVLELGLEPITCSDMLLAYPESIDRLHPRYAIADWDYWTVEASPPFMKDWKTKQQIPLAKVEELPGETKQFYKQHLIREDGTYRAFGYTNYFIERGYSTYALPSTAAVGPGCYWVPRYGVHAPNIVQYIQHGKRYGVVGVLNTIWERSLFETTLYGIVLGAEYSWGQPSGGVDQLNRNFAALYFGLSSPDAVNAFYRLSEPYAIVEKRFPRIYTNRLYGREDIPMADIAANEQLERNIEETKALFEALQKEVKWNEYTLEQWALGAAIKRFWLGVVQSYARLKGAAEQDAARVEGEIEALDKQLAPLKADIAEVLIKSMPLEKVVHKNEESFQLWNELKAELRAGTFR